MILVWAIDERRRCEIPGRHEFEPFEIRRGKVMLDERKIVVDREGGRPGSESFTSTLRERR